MVGSKTLAIGLLLASVCGGQTNLIRLSIEDRVAFLEIQREQHRQYAAREKARADMLQADAYLQMANAEFAAKREEMRKKYNCVGGEIVGDALNLAGCGFPEGVEINPHP